MLEEQNKWSDIPSLITLAEREWKQVTQLREVTGILWPFFKIWIFQSKTLTLLLFRREFH